MMKKIVFSIIVVVSLHSFFSCGMEENERLINNIEIQIIGFHHFDIDTYNQSSVVSFRNDEEKILEFGLYLPEGGEGGASGAEKVLLHEITFEVTQYIYVDWDLTTFSINGEDLMPEVTITKMMAGDYPSANALVTFSWYEKTSRPLVLKNNMVLNIMLIEDVPVYTQIGFLTGMVIFKDFHSCKYYVGTRDVDLGREGFSGVLHGEQHSLGGFPTIMIVD